MINKRITMIFYQIYHLSTNRSLDFSLSKQYSNQEFTIISAMTIKLSPTIKDHVS